MPTAPTRPRDRLIGVVLVTALTLAAWLPSVDFHLLNWDDKHHVWDNDALVDDSAPLEDRWLGRNIGYALPLTLLSWRIDRARFGPQAGERVEPAMGQGYHTTQVMLIVAFGLALLALGLATVGGTMSALSVAGLVVLHPVAAEPLAWITGRKDLLAALFVVLATLSLWRGLRGGWPSWRWLLAAFGCASLAVASKPSAVGLAPFFVWALWLGRTVALDKPAVRRVVAGGMAGLALVCAASVAVGMAWHAELGGVEEVEQGPLGVLRRAWWALGFHVRMLGAPGWLRAKYVVAPPEGFAPLEDLLALAALVATSALALHPRTRRRPAGWGAALAITLWLPVSNLVPLRRFVADSYLLAPGVGLALIVVDGLGAALRHRGLRGALSVAVLALLFVRQAPQRDTWRDSTALWTHVIAHEPRSPEVCRMAGHAVAFDGDPARAVQVYEGCAERFGPALFANNLAITSLMAGDVASARRWLAWLAGDEAAAVGVPASIRAKAAARLARLPR